MMRLCACSTATTGEGDGNGAVKKVVGGVLIACILLAAVIIGAGAPSEPTASPTIQNIMELPDFAPLEPGTYFIDPDADPSTPLRVVYEVPMEGWSQWIGAFRRSSE